MAPLVLITTVVTHLFGGSAGREGTAVQMGGSLAELISGMATLKALDRRIMLMAGISGGFGAVFGTPLAGMVFGLEVLTVGRIDYEGLVACMVAGIVGDVVCRAWGIDHVHYSVTQMPNLSATLILLIVASGAVFALASMLFSEFTDFVHRTAKRFVSRPWLRAFLGGCAIIALTYAVGTRDYLGLSIPMLKSSFNPGSIVLWAFALKILFTAITLGTGFKGGEVTPLFVIGGTLGYTIATLTHQSVSFFAALGFVSVFAGAANTPLACIVMGIELFGAPMAVPIAISCVVTYILSGHRGIYLSQRIGTSKASSVVVPDKSTLREARDGAQEVVPSRFPQLSG
jgi:H+/Cl- antiporter ClcA